MADIIITSLQDLYDALTPENVEHISKQITNVCHDIVRIKATLDEKDAKELKFSYFGIFEDKERPKELRLHALDTGKTRIIKVKK